MLVLDLGIKFELNDAELVEMDDCEYEVRSNTLREKLENRLSNDILDLHLILNV